MKVYDEAEKYIKDIFYPETFDFGCDFNVANVLRDKMLEVEKDPEYYNHRTGVVHVSSLYRCLPGLVREMLGHKSVTEPDPRKLGVFQAGHLFEEFIVNSLGARVLDRQKEYSLPYKNIVLVGRDDGTFVDDKGVKRILECKSVHSDSFWYREKEGTLVSAHNQVQLQTYMWLRRQLYGEEIDGYFTYVSKDDCTVVGVPVKFNQHIIDEIVIPILDAINDAYTAGNPDLVPMPKSIVYNDSKKQFQTNWVCKYCDYHGECAGANWLVEAQAEIKERNKRLKAGESPESIENGGSSLSV